MSEIVSLRDVQQSDLEIFFAQEQDPQALHRSKFTAREHDRFMAHWATEVLGDDTVFVQTVTVDGETAGNVVAWWQDDARYIGYWLGRAYWGRGVGSRALTQFLAAEPHRPLHADPFSGNAASVRLLERCGFQHAGTVRHDGREHLLLVLSAERAG